MLCSKAVKTSIDRLGKGLIVGQDAAGQALLLDELPPPLDEVEVRGAGLRAAPDGQGPRGLCHPEGAGESPGALPPDPVRPVYLAGTAAHRGGARAWRRR